MINQIKCTVHTNYAPTHLPNIANFLMTQVNFTINSTNTQGLVKPLLPKVSVKSHPLSKSPPQIL